MRKITYIDLHLPTCWRELTTRQVERVASIMVESIRDNGKDGINLEYVKARLFFYFTGLVIIRQVNEGEPIEERRFLVRRDGIKEEFEIGLWEIHYWMEQMKWIERPSDRLITPYEHYSRWTWSGRHRYKGPSALMQDFSYQQYRLAGEYMNFYVLESNKLAAMKADADRKALRRQMQAVAKAKGLFLASLFTRRCRYRDVKTRNIKRGYIYHSLQSSENWKDFAGFPEEKFQCVLFWWSATLNWLRKQYPKVFRETSPKKNAMVNPLEVYSRTTATMEKYLGINEESLNNELYLNVLQHLQDMMDESDRMKELERKHH